jgi:hypothetical protein
MEGACVYINKNSLPEIAVYKELKNYNNYDNINNVLFCLYSNKTLQMGYISTRTLTNILPKNSIHVLTHLPYINNTHETIQLWKSLLINKLNILNKNW